VTNQLEIAIRIPCRLAAENTKPRTQIVSGRSVRAPCTELLDSNREAM